jgi:hypothetical protein
MRQYSLLLHLRRTTHLADAAAVAALPAQAIAAAAAAPAAQLLASACKVTT